MKSYDSAPNETHMDQISVKTSGTFLFLTAASVTSFPRSTETSLVDNSHGKHITKRLVTLQSVRYAGFLFINHHADEKKGTFASRRTTFKS